MLQIRWQVLGVVSAAVKAIVGYFIQLFYMLPPTLSLTCRPVKPLIKSKFSSKLLKEFTVTVKMKKMMTRRRVFFRVKVLLPALLAVFTSTFIKPQCISLHSLAPRSVWTLWGTLKWKIFTPAANTSHCVVLMLQTWTLLSPCRTLPWKWSYWQTRCRDEVELDFFIWTLFKLMFFIIPDCEKVKKRLRRQCCATACVWPTSGVKLN